MMRRVNGRRSAGISTGAALVAGLALRVFFVRHHPIFSGDVLVYGDLAKNMLAHHTFGLSEDVVRPALIRLPGYPLFLATCFVVFGTEHYMAVLWAQAGLDLVTCIVLAKLARDLWGRRAGLTALWVTALCPFLANYAADGIAETLTFLSIAVALLSLERWAFKRKAGWLILLGVALMEAALLRPDGCLLAVALLPAVAWLSFRPRAEGERSRPWAVPLAALPLVLALGAWTVRNERVMHVLQPLAPRYATDPGEMISYGFQRWYRTWAIGFDSTYNVYWNYDGSELKMSDLPARAFDSPAQREATGQVIARYNDESAATQPVDDAFGELAAERVRARPLRFYVLLPVARELDMWLRPRTELFALPLDWWHVRAHPRASAIEIAYAALNAVLLGLGLVGLWRWGRRGWGGNGALAGAMLGYVALRCALLFTLDNSEPRYALECFPVVLLLASLALTPKATLSD